MSQPGDSAPPPGERSARPAPPDPWAVIGRLVAGVGMYGFLGWLGDRWLGTPFLLPVGIVVGAALGLVATIAMVRSP